MMMTDKITPVPYNEGMTMTENSWVVVDCSTSNETKVTFYTPEQDNHEEGSFNNLQEFADAYLEDNALLQEQEVTTTEGKISIQSSTSEETDDFDEDSGKSWKYFVANAQLIDFYQKFNIANLPGIVAETEKDLENIEKDEVANAEDSAEYHKDPYAYYGVSRRDFL
jgi:hypothetical protein